MPFTSEDINVSLVARLVAAQFPQWADLPIRPVAFSGWDNRTFRLGEDMSVRLPSAERYILQVDKEQRWLPRLAPLLSGDSRAAFFATLQVDGATRVRGRGWALWKGLITLAKHIKTNSAEAEKARRVIDDVLADDASGSIP